MQTRTRGDRGPEVRRLQMRLSDLGFSPQGVDGAFEEHTEEALRLFQRDWGLADSGRMDLETFEALFPLQTPRPSVIDAVKVGTPLPRRWPRLLGRGVAGGAVRK